MKTRFGLATKSGKDKFRSKTRSYRKPDKGYRQVQTTNKSAQKKNSDRTKLRPGNQIRNSGNFVPKTNSNRKTDSNQTNIRSENQIWTNDIIGERQIQIKDPVVPKTR